MSDLKVTRDERELQETHEELTEALVHCRFVQQQIDQGRKELAEQALETQANLEATIARYEQQRDTLDREEQHLHIEQQKFEEARQWIEMQLAAKQDVQQSQDTSPTTKDAVKQTTGGPAPPMSPVTKDEIRRMTQQLKLIKLDHKLKPPAPRGSGNELDKELKRMTEELNQKQKIMQDASQNLRHNWDRSTGPKP